MGQKLRDDKIGALGHSGGIITMTASSSNPAWLTIGGQQYRITSNLSRTITTDVTLTANSLYMIYAVNNSGNIELRISANVNSIGPAGFNSWKLVGAFYSNGVGSIAFGGFVTIEGTPTSEVISYTPTGNFTSNVGYVGRWQRIGKTLLGSIDMTFSGVPSPSGPTNFSMPANQQIDLTGLANGGNGDRVLVGQANFFDNGAANYWGRIGISSSTILLIGYVNASGTFGVNGNGTETTPFTLNNTDSISAQITVPALGWSTTPLKDL